jgi:S1-C subfamily serine protease
MVEDRRAVLKLTVTGAAPDGKVKAPAEGTGFVIHSSTRNSLILTAAHVVGSSDWRPKLNPNWLVEEDGRLLNRRVRIGILDPHGTLTDLAHDAAVIFQDDQKDIAVLLVDRTGLPFFPFMENVSEIQGDVQTVRVLGFRKDEQALEIRQCTGQLQCPPQRGLVFRLDQRLAKGLSGGPVIDIASGKVIALVSANFGSGQDHHAVPLFPVLPSIAPYIDFAAKLQPVSRATSK